MKNKIITVFNMVRLRAQTVQALRVKERNGLPIEKDGRIKTGAEGNTQLQLVLKNIRRN